MKVQLQEICRMGWKIPGPIEGVFVTKMIKSFHTYVQMYEIFFFSFFSFFHFFFSFFGVVTVKFYLIIIII